MSTEIYFFYVGYLKHQYKFALAAYRSGLTQLIFTSRGLKVELGKANEL